MVKIVMLLALNHPPALHKIFTQVMNCESFYDDWNENG